MSATHQRKELSAWFRRVSALAKVSWDEEVRTFCFDEDMSDIESPKPARHDEKCKPSGEDRDSEGQPEDEEDMSDFDDDMSEESYDGPEAEWYYYLKELREERKDNLREMARKKQAAREYESGKEEEVRAAYEALRKAKREGKKPHLEPLDGKTFRLYSTDHVEHFWDTIYAPKHVNFHHVDEDFLDASHLSGPPWPWEQEAVYTNGKRTVQGQIYLDSGTGCEFPEFRSPSRPSRRKRVMESHDGKHKIVFKFISNEYLTVKLSRDLVFEDHHEPVPESAPKFFKFSGILLNWKKERVERLHRQH
ncbi:uncharacterized protein CTRU02_204748 [Colletotrichum truncatum]|uniref:Uncharacterized protein n=1 Tax=Colletotrichum truncatum TaxID=5467 RepID=A0ACC3ZD92_COLTU|nr:uncharacterized protein CTRU02_02982 [Colletotrichum truncatum]KAF6797940.1 hypothetical protein CTRU02_02982 [Colletotrichum truncatum]